MPGPGQEPTKPFMSIVPAMKSGCANSVIVFTRTKKGVEHRRTCNTFREINEIMHAIFSLER